MNCGMQSCIGRCVGARRSGLRRVVGASYAPSAAPSHGAAGWREILAGVDESIRLELVLLVVERPVAAARARAARHACRARRSRRARSPESDRRCGSSIAGARSRTSSGPGAASAGRPGSALRSRCRGSTSPRRGRGARGFARIARAIATRWRWPPESFTPRSPTTVSYFFSN